MTTSDNRYSIEYKDYKVIKQQIRHKLKRHIEVEVIRDTVDPIVHVIEEEDEVTLKPEKKQMSTEEKLQLLDKLAGSVDRFSPEGVLETIRIANREYDQEEA